MQISNFFHTRSEVFTIRSNEADDEELTRAKIHSYIKIFMNVYRELSKKYINKGQ